MRSAQEGLHETSSDAGPASEGRGQVVTRDEPDTLIELMDVQPSHVAPRHVSISKSEKHPGIRITALEDTRARSCNPWSCSLLTLLCSAFAVIALATIGYSFTSRDFDNPKGCRMSYMRATFVLFREFDTEYTRSASKYSLYLYREGGIDEDPRVKGVPVLFIPGNAGSYKQVRPFAAEAANHFHQELQHDKHARANGAGPLDFFTVDFNEDITAFHGRTLLEQADYLNDAIAYILSLYHDPQKSLRDPNLPDPTSVIIVGHSMGGIVARTMLTRARYVSNSINTIITLSAPHSRPPISFDSDMVSIYNDINQYWEESYAERWASRNPLWHVTLVSIAGGGLDTVVPSDYASLTSIVPETHGFAVFTSTIPHVWTGMDHLAIMWCDQLRRAVVRSIYDVADVTRPSQTRPRAERMRLFRKRLLTGLESDSHKSINAQEATMLLSAHVDQKYSNASIAQGLSISSLGDPEKPPIVLMTLPSANSRSHDQRFTLLTDQAISGSGLLDVYFCSFQPKGHMSLTSSVNFAYDLTNGDPKSTKFVCKNAAIDNVALPPSTNVTRGYSDEKQPFSFLEYSLRDLSDFQYVAVVDKATEPRAGWLIAELSDARDNMQIEDKSLKHILTHGVHTTLPAKRAVLNTIHVPAIHSSLLTYRLDIKQNCANDQKLFLPLVRQYTIQPYESRFFVDPTRLFINLHSTSPYLSMPQQGELTSGLSLQIWSDPACDGTTEVSMQLDLLGSAGQLYMRYRTAFAAFPLLIIALVLRKQFRVYNETGIFITFADAIDKCLRTSLPLMFLALTCLSISLTTPGRLLPDEIAALLSVKSNDLLLGAQDQFFWFLIPLFGLVGVGVCIAANYIVLILTSGLTLLHVRLRSTIKEVSTTWSTASYNRTSPLQRVVTTGVLLALVATVIPYQFAYVVLCIVQLATCVRARTLVRGNQLAATNFHAYAHSILILMLWILPINLPVLIVWIHNLAVHWLTPFSSHHNILSITPFILMVELLSTGCMIPRLATFRFLRSERNTSFVRDRGLLDILTNVLLFGMACFAAIFGVTYAYMLHQCVNWLCAWLLVLHVLSPHTTTDRKQVNLTIAPGSVVNDCSERGPTSEKVSTLMTNMRADCGTGQKLDRPRVAITHNDGLSTTEKANSTNSMTPSPTESNIEMRRSSRLRQKI